MKKPPDSVRAVLALWLLAIALTLGSQGTSSLHNPFIVGVPPRSTRAVYFGGMPREFGLLLIGAGAVAVVVGLIAPSGGLSWFGRLPGDVRSEHGGARVFIPITSMLLVSAGATLVLNVVRRLL